MSKPDLRGIVETLDAAREKLNNLPDDQDWTDEELGQLDDVRMSCNHLAREIEATIETYEGKLNHEED